MFVYRNKVYASASEALDDYISNFDFENYEFSFRLSNDVFNNNNRNDESKANICFTNKNKKQYPRSILKNSVSNQIPKKIEVYANEADLEFKKIESMINTLSSRIEEHKKTAITNVFVEDTNHTVNESKCGQLSIPNSSIFNDLNIDKILNEIRDVLN